MKIYLHLGAHKTGSTFIQKACYELSDELLQYGVYYPREGFSQYGHHEIAWKINSGDISGARYLLDQIVSRAKEEKCESVVISSEEFEFSRNPDAIKKLFSGFFMEAILYLRRQDEYLESEYNQHVKMFSTRFSKDIFKFFMYHNFNNRFNYYNLISFWENKVGASCVYVKSYTLAKQQKGGLLKNFLLAIGVPDKNSLSEIFSTNVINQSLSSLSVMYMARFNRLPRISFDKHQSIITQSISLLDNAPESSSQCFLDEEYSKRLVSKYHSSNKKVFDDYFGGKNCFPGEFCRGEVVDFYESFDELVFKEIAKKAGVL